MRIFIVIAAACAALAGYPALAEDAASQQPTRIEIDQQTKTFIFIIDENPVALLDQDGLHVREGIKYGASLTDGGSASFDDRIKALTKEAAHE